MNKLIVEDDIIYHYTTTPVLNEFLKPDARLYATHWAFMNDKEELCHLRYQKDRILKEAQEERNYYQRKKESPKDEEYLVPEKLVKLYSKSYYPPIFLLSFSANADDLSMWRGYAPKGGYSIGFSKSELISNLKEPKTILPSLTEEPVNFYVSSYQTVLSKCEYAPLEEIRKLDNMNHYMYYMFYKDIGFREEKETRIAVSCDIEKSAKGIELVGNKPRIQIIFRDGFKVNSAIRKIVVSPHGEAQRNQVLADLLGLKYGLHDIEIMPSRIPYTG